MVRHIASPTIVGAAGNMPKKIEEFVGAVNSSTAEVSIARMTSPAGWVEPGQRPDFDEYTIVLAGTLRVASGNGETIDVGPGETIIAGAGDWVQYSSPNEGGAQYIAVCLPGFTPDAVHRDE